MQLKDKKRIRLTVADRVDFLLWAQAELCSAQAGRPVSVGEVIEGILGQMRLDQWKSMREDLQSGSSVPRVELKEIKMTRPPGMSIVDRISLRGKEGINLDMAEYTGYAAKAGTYAQLDETDFIYERSIEWLVDIIRTAKQNGIEYVNDDLTVHEFLEHDDAWRIEKHYGWSYSLDYEFDRQAVSQISSWFYDQLESLQLSGEEQETLWEEFDSIEGRTGYPNWGVLDDLAEYRLGELVGKSSCRMRMKSSSWTKLRRSSTTALLNGLPLSMIGLMRRWRRE